jgi:hypothetical protein
MRDWVKQALRRKIRHKGRPSLVTEADDKLVLLVKFSLGMAACLTALEIADLVLLGSWSSEVFAALTGLIGTVTGVLIGRRT